MLSGVIFPKRSYPAMPRAGQLVHQGFIILGPLVQKNIFLNFKRPKKIGSVLFLNALNPTHVIIFPPWGFYTIRGVKSPQQLMVSHKIGLYLGKFHKPQGNHKETTRKPQGNHNIPPKGNKGKKRWENNPNLPYNTFVRP